MDANRSWWVSALRAADCGKAWLHPGWEDTMWRWYDWLHEMKKRNEAKTIEVEHQKLVSRMIYSADGSTGALAQNDQANGLERRKADSEE